MRPFTNNTEGATTSTHAAIPCQCAAVRFVGSTGRCFAVTWPVTGGTTNRSPTEGEQGRLKAGRAEMALEGAGRLARGRDAEGEGKPSSLLHDYCKHWRDFRWVPEEGLELGDWHQRLAIGKQAPKWQNEQQLGRKGGLGVNGMRAC